MSVRVTIEEWFPVIRIPMAIEQYRQLPRHAAYRYEYLEGEACLTPRPRSYHALLHLVPRTVPESVTGFGREVITFRPVKEHDWPQLVAPFAEAFHQVPPFSLIPQEDRLTAAAECLEKTRSGGDGPLIKSASFVARCDIDDAEAKESDQKTDLQTGCRSTSAVDPTECIVGAMLVTLMQAGDLERFDDPEWQSTAPSNAIEQNWGRPHLTWIFTHSWMARHGIGSALLDHAVNALDELGYRELASTFLLGNDSSALWHWRNEFDLNSYPGSPRARQRDFIRAASRRT